MKLIDKDALVAEIERRLDELYDLLPDASKVENGSITTSEACNTGKYTALESFRNYIDILEVKDIDLMVHTIIAECCDWLAFYTNLSHDEIEGCRNLMLTVKDEQLKAQKGEEV